MNKDNYYLMRLSFHPDPKADPIFSFSTFEEARKRLDELSTNDKNEGAWVIISKKIDETFEIVFSCRIAGRS